MMTQYETIFKRKSTRKYDMEKLNKTELTEINVFIGNLKSFKIKTELPFIIALAFGKPEGSPHRELSEFKRTTIT